MRTPLQQQCDEIVEKIKPLLAGQHPGVQGVVLADLLAIWLAGHPHDLQDALMASHVRGVERLVPIYREQLGTQRPLH